MAISRRYGRDPGLLERLQHGVVRFGRGEDFPVVAVVAQIVGAGFEDECPSAGLRWPFRLSMMIWLLRSNIQATLPCSPMLPPFFENDVADFADRAVAVIGRDLDQHRGAAGTVAFERDFVDLAAFEFAGAAHDGALDVVGGHADGFGGQ